METAKVYSTFISFNFLLRLIQGVGNTLKRHYETYLLEYELAHDDVDGECCLLCRRSPSISFFVLLCLRNYSIKELTTNMVCFIYSSVVLLETGLTVAYAGSGPILDATEDPVWVPLK